MTEIPLSNSLEKCLIDDSDLDLVKDYCWRITFNRNGKYVCVNRHNNLVYIHKLIMNSEGWNLIDHKDGNGLNNQRSNLRKSNFSANQLNTDKYINSVSKYRGVSFYSKKKDKNKWITRLYYKGKGYSLGCYDTETEAALAYNRGLERICPGQGRPNIIT